MRHFAPPHLAFLICSIWLCRKLLCFKYLLVTGSAAYLFRQRQSRHRRRNKRHPAAKGQALRGARLKALLALDFCLFMRGSSCESPGSQYATTDTCRSTQGFSPDPRTILWTGVGYEKRKRMAEKRSSLSVRGSRVELPRLLRHYLLRVARLPISPPAHQNGLQIYELFCNSQAG